jgi:ligand-binding SRPBCC domain-containing protein
MKSHMFETTQVLPISISEAWEFFSNPKNLSRITPPQLCFTVLTTMDDREINEGMQIDYTVRPLWGIKVRWQTVISHVNKPFRFTDKQAIGPYRLWEHTHTFQPCDGGIVMHDHVNYQLPFGWFGRIFNRLVVRRKIREIFDYRRVTLDNLFAGK